MLSQHMSRSAFSTALRTAIVLFADAAWLRRLMLQSRMRLAAENMFLRKQLALYLEREVKPCTPQKLRLVSISIRCVQTRLGGAWLCPPRWSSSVIDLLGGDRAANNS
jgi:hypothetical protein